MKQGILLIRNIQIAVFKNWSVDLLLIVPETIYNVINKSTGSEI